MVAQPSAHHHAGVNVVAVDLGHLQAHLAVVDQDRVAGRDIAGQPGVGRPTDPLVALDGTRRDRELVVGSDLNRSIGEGLQADLRTLQVGEDPDPVAGCVRGLANQAIGPFVVLVGAVTHIEPGHVHPDIHQLAHRCGAAHRRTQGADDLRSTHHPSLRPFYRSNQKSTEKAGQTVSGRADGGIGDGNAVDPVR